VKRGLYYFVLNERDTEDVVGLPGLVLDLTRVRRDVRGLLPSLGDGKASTCFS
jgi:hypothetical protein